MLGKGCDLSRQRGCLALVFGESVWQDRRGKCSVAMSCTAWSVEGAWLMSTRGTTHILTVRWPSKYLNVKMRKCCGASFVRRISWLLYIISTWFRFTMPGKAR